MTFLSLVAALLMEQWRALDRDNAVALLFSSYAQQLERQFNAGESRHGMIAWVLGVVPLAAAVALIQVLAGSMALALEWAWCVAVLYATMGFRKFSHHFTDLQEALARDDLPAARELLARIRPQSAGEFTRGETARVAIEEGLLLSHRYVFGVIAWFTVFGPAGAAAYRASAMLAERWGGRASEDAGAFGQFAVRAFEIMDWVPVRLTALSFAIAGDFEDAIYCWRTQAASWAPQAVGVLLATGGGALGVRLGEALHQHGGLNYRPEMGTGEEADADFLQSGIGLLWRTLVIWMLLILLLSIAHWVG
ncbi:MAG TPA: CobD/CbiB family protein [Burkholderiales bacterium]|nr:CobD/CbiB family protein [Burkholderiales bacterium]